MAFPVYPENVNPAAGGAGLLLYIVVLKSINDASQCFRGREFGKTCIALKSVQLR